MVFRPLSLESYTLALSVNRGSDIRVWICPKADTRLYGLLHVRRRYNKDQERWMDVAKWKGSSVLHQGVSRVCTLARFCKCPCHAKSIVHPSFLFYGGN